MKLYKVDYHSWIITDSYFCQNPGILFYEAESILDAQKQFRIDRGISDYRIDNITEIGDKK